MRRLVSVAIVFIVLALAIGLMVPKIMFIRERAADMRCQNNLKQLALAIENYRLQHGHYPSGTFPHPKLPPEKRLSWLVALDPYIHSTGAVPDPVAAWDAEANLGVPSFSPSITHCRLAGPGVEGPHAPTSYVGVAGIGADAATLPLSSPRAGFFGYDRATKKADLRRGAANTLMVIETAHQNGPRSAGGFATMRGIDPDDGHPIESGGPFASLHPGQAGSSLFSRKGMTFGVTADGRVRWIDEEIDPAVLAALATLAGDQEWPD